MSILQLSTDTFNFGLNNNISYTMLLNIHVVDHGKADLKSHLTNLDFHSSVTILGHNLDYNTTYWRETSAPLGLWWGLNIKSRTSSTQRFTLINRGHKFVFKFLNFLVLFDETILTYELLTCHIYQS